MPLKIKEIKANEHFEYKGDVELSGSIGKNATVVVKDGSLSVGENIGDEANIKLEQKSSNISVSGGSIFFGGVSCVSIGGSNKVLETKGDICNSVKINTSSASLEVAGDIGTLCKIKTISGDVSSKSIGKGSTINTTSGSIAIANVADNVHFNSVSGDFRADKAGNNTHVRTTSGDITTGAIGDDSTLSSVSGDFRVAGIGSSSTLRSTSGDISANYIGENSTATTVSGDINIRKAPASADVSSTSGDVTLNGKRQKRERNNYGSSSIFMNGISISGGSFGGGRVIINGRDLSDIMREQNSSQSSSDAPEEKPVRYMKK